MIDPAEIDRERATLKQQVHGLVRVYGPSAVNALAIVLKADTLYDSLIRSLDTPAEARMQTVRAISRQLSGKPASYQDISDSHFALGDQSNVPEQEAGYAWVTAHRT